MHGARPGPCDHRKELRRSMLDITTSDGRTMPVTVWETYEVSCDECGMTIATDDERPDVCAEIAHSYGARFIPYEGTRCHECMKQWNLDNCI